MDDNNRPPGCVLPLFSASQPPQVPSRSALPIHHPPFRSVRFTQSFYKVCSSDCGTLTAPRDQNIPVPARLVTTRGLQRSTALSPSVHPVSPSCFGHPGKYQEIPPRPCSASSLYRGDLGLGPLQGISTPGQGPNSKDFGRLSDFSSQFLSVTNPVLAGTHVSSHSGSPPCKASYAPHPIMVPAIVQIGGPQSVKTPDTTIPCSQIPKLVDSNTEPHSGNAFLPPNTSADSHHRRLTLGLGSSSQRFLCGCTMAQFSPLSTRQLPQAPSSFSGPQEFSAQVAGKDGPNILGQHVGSLLCKQARRCGLQVPLPAGSGDLGLLYCSRHHATGDAPPRQRQYSGRCSQPRRPVDSRAHSDRRIDSSCFRSLRDGRDQRFCNGKKQEMPPILQQRWHRPAISWRWPPPRLEEQISVHVSFSTINSKGPTQVRTGTAQMHHSDSLVAPTHVVLLPPQSLCPQVLPRTGDSLLPWGADTVPQSAEAHGMASHLTLSEDVLHVLLNPRKPSTRRSYKAKWTANCVGLFDGVTYLRPELLFYQGIFVSSFFPPSIGRSYDCFLILWQKGSCVVYVIFSHLHVLHHLLGTYPWNYIN